MKSSRSTFLATGAVSSLSDQELCGAISDELKSGIDHRVVLTTVPAGVPDWVNDERRLKLLEAVAIRRFGSIVCRDELAKIAGDFNPRPTARQRCEAVLSAARRVRADVIPTSTS